MDLDPVLKKQLIQQWFDLKVARELGEDISIRLKQLESRLGCPDLDEFFHSDCSDEYVIEYAWRWQAQWPRLSRNEMIKLVKHIIGVRGSEAEVSIMVDNFVANCVHPGKSELLFHKRKHFGEGVQPTVEEIVDKAMDG